VANEAFPLPHVLAANQERYHGEAGRRWVEGLPALAAEITQSWQLTLEPPFLNGFSDYAAPARRADGSQVVLKLCYVDVEFRGQASALAAFDGNAAVRLLEADIENGALLLERLIPGEPLSRLSDDTMAMHEAAEILRQLWQAPHDDAALLSLDEWVKDANQPGVLPATKRSQPWIAKALAEAHEAVSSSTERVLLHGDLHQDNILSSERGWLAIDAKGIVGDPAWDLAPLLFNNLDQAGVAWRTLLRRRLDQLCDELSLERNRAYVLSAARALQSRFWSLQDGTQAADSIIERAYHVAEELSKGP
jgi:streptomycin 6-kinase